MISSPEPAGAPAGRWTAACLIALFTLSGLSGLIYESIWAHYLKLLLGHAAYAQTVVLVIFMGGMAAGAWYAGRRSSGWRNLLLGYALVEGVIGVAGLVFHDVFDAASAWALASVMPALPGPAAVQTFKWGLAASLVLPQSVLLGMTFPLMSGAFIRRRPAASGRALAVLYFANSLGASIGVLLGGFWLVPAVGLPGTVLTAGLVNVALALAVWAIARRGEPPPLAAEALDAGPSPAAARGPAIARMLLLVAFGTGLASFVYEITWVRMLSLVLGSSTHAFELMLSAFILGLALGSLWVRRRIESTASPLAFLASVQVAMGALSLATLLLYDASFDWMAWFMQGVQRNDTGYTLFNVVSHLTAFVVMLPVTVCAGMTLPLITYTLMRGGHGERSIGQVYAANTLGAIVGVIGAVHVGLPWLGMEGSLAFGAAVDIALGVALAVMVSQPERTRRAIGAFGTVGGVSLIALALLTAQFDPRKLVSGVYRYGDLDLLGGGRVSFHEDGKTATVNLIDYPVGVVAILTNGKTDATVMMRPGGAVSSDEYTMTLAGILPLAANPGARHGAVIGFGAGMSTHMLLGSPAIERVDTVEIEPRMVDAARAYHARVRRAFDDPRSHVHFDDARSFFSTQQRRYDVLMSEPSQPWVSGIAALYTEEFYAQARRHLADDGVFAQWLHGTELSTGLVASVAKAIGAVFDDYAVYNLNERDLLFIARPRGRVWVDTEWPFGIDALREELARIDVHGPGDLRVRYLGSKALLGQWLSEHPLPTNSDYFPVLALGAARTSFLRTRAREMFQLRRQPVPLVEMLAPGMSRIEDEPVTAAARLEQGQVVRAARRFAGALHEASMSGPSMSGDWTEDAAVPVRYRERLGSVALALRACGAGLAAPQWWEATEWLAHHVLPHLSGDPAAELAAALDPPGCAASRSAAQSAWLDLLAALGAREAQPLVGAGLAYLHADRAAPVSRREVAVAAVMLGSLSSGRPRGALEILARYGAGLDIGSSIALQVLAAAASPSPDGGARSSSIAFDSPFESR